MFARASTQIALPERRRAQHLGAQLGGHAPRLLPVAARDADQARVVGVVLERLLVRPQLLEQRADLVVDEPLVRDPAERRERLGAGRGCRRGGIVTRWSQREDASAPSQVGDLGEALAERAQVRIHRG